MSLEKLARAALFRLDAETAHAATINSWKRFPRLSGRLFRVCESQPVRCMGLSFRNPVGVAAGLDKNGECIRALAGMGFGFVEVGTVTPRPQTGNPRPRMFRLPEYESVINRLGFNNKGVDYLCRQVARAPRDCIIGINIGKNADTPNDQAERDYLHCLDKVYPLADYVTINISSPNTRDLRALQEAEPLRRLIGAICGRRDQLATLQDRRVPLALKVAPDLDDTQRSALASVLNESDIDAVIATNTTIQRDSVAGHPLAGEAGGLSGRALQGLAQAQFVALRAALRPDLPMIGVGGICDGPAARERFAAGAELVQVYTGFVYRGPALLAEAIAAARD